MSSVNLDSSPVPELGIVGMQIAKKSAQTLASVVTQALTATEEIGAQAQAAPAPGTGQQVDLSA